MRGIPRAELLRLEQLCMLEDSKKVAVRVGAGGQQGTDTQGPWPLSMVLTLSLEETATDVLASLDGWEASYPGSTHLTL